MLILGIRSGRLPEGQICPGGEFNKPRTLFVTNGQQVAQIAANKVRVSIKLLVGSHEDFGRYALVLAAMELEHCWNKVRFAQ